MSFGSPKWRDWVLPEEESRLVIRKALELGVNCFDLANVYSEGSCEEVVGRALKDLARRDEVVIATKVYFPVGPGPNQRGLSRLHIIHAVDASLRRLGTDYIDLYQIHRWDDATPIAETLDALHDLVKVGKVRYIGASGVRAWQLSEALHVADSRDRTAFISVQNHYNLLYREEEREMLPLCRAKGVGVIPWSPLARGLLVRRQATTGEAQTVRARSDERIESMYRGSTDFEIVDRVASLARERETSAARIALAWLLQKPAVVAPIIGATNTHHVQDAVGALDVELGSDEMEYLQEPYVPHEVIAG